MTTQLSLVPLDRENTNDNLLPQVSSLLISATSSRHITIHLYPPVSWIKRWVVRLVSAGNEAT